MLRWRQDQKTHEWKVFGPLAEFGGKAPTVTVQKKNGEVAAVEIQAVSKSFIVDGIPHAYGYPRKRVAGNGNGASHTPRLRRDGTYECDECGDYVRPGTRCWETGMIH